MSNTQVLLPAGSMPRLWNNVLIMHRADGYWNGDSMCLATGKQWQKYWENVETEQFLNALSIELRLPVLRIRATGEPADHPALVDRVQGGQPALQGNWVHRRVAVHLAGWCSPACAVKVSGWVEELLTRGHVELSRAGAPAAPVIQPWCERIQRSIVQHRALIARTHSPGHWSVYTATTVDL